LKTPEEATTEPPSAIFRSSGSVRRLHHGIVHHHLGVVSTDRGDSPGARTHVVGRHVVGRVHIRSSIGQNAGMAIMAVNTEAIGSFFNSRFRWVLSWRHRRRSTELSGAG